MYFLPPFFNLIKRGGKKIFQISAVMRCALAPNDSEGERTEQNCGAIRTTLCKMLASDPRPKGGGASAFCITFSISEVFASFHYYTL